MNIFLKLIWIMLCASSIASIYDVPVRPEIRNALQRQPFFEEIQSPSGTETLGTASSTITGWGFPIGTPTNFSRVSFPMRYSVANYAPSTARVRIRANDYQGAILADATVALALDFSIKKTIEVTFTNSVNAGSTNLWMEILTDGRIDEYQATILYASPTARYWTDGSLYSPSTSPLTAASQRNWPVTVFRESSSDSGLAISPEFSQYMGTAQLLERMVTPTYMIDVDSTIGTPGSTQLGSSTSFSGWGQYAGNVTNANAFGFYLYPSDADNLPSQVRVRVRQMPEDTAAWTNSPTTWAILGTATLDVSTTANRYTKVTVRFGESTSFNGHIWVEYVTNGKDNARAVATSSYTRTDPPLTRYVTGSSLSDSSWLAVVSARHFYLEVGTGTDELASFDVTQEFKSQLSVYSGSSIVMNMAPTYYALEGQQANVYFDNIVRSSQPIESLRFNVGGGYGKQYGSFGGFWRLTPTGSDIGTNSASIEIVDPTSDEVLATETFSLVVAASNAPAIPVSRKVVFIGDSTLGGSGAAVLAETVRLFSTDTNLVLTLVGSNDGTYADSTGSNRTVRCEAISGWTAGRFATNSTDAWTEIGGTARTGSPFVYGGTLNFAAWASSNSITLASNDWAFIHLGINDVFGATTDAAASALISECVTHIDLLATNIQAVVPGLRVMVALIIPPNASQDAFAADYSADQTRWRYKRNRDLLNESIKSQFSSRAGSRIFLLDYGSALDSVNNFASSAQPVNSRNSATYLQPSVGSGVHPAPAGYYQMADAIRCAFKAQE